MRPKGADIQAVTADSDDPMPRLRPRAARANLGRPLRYLALVAALAISGLGLSSCVPPVATDAKPAPANTTSVKAAAAPATAGSATLTGTSSVAGLDSSGTTIPVTNYPIPTGAIFIATSGKDTNAGTRTAPVVTLARAYTLVKAGGTIVVRGGTYRDGNLTATKAFTLQAYPGEKPWFDGTNLVKTWTSDGKGHYFVAWSTPDFCKNTAYPNGGYYSQIWPWLGTPSAAGPCIHPDMADDPINPGAADPQMVFLDGRYLTEVTTLAKVTSSSFFYDFTTRRVYIGITPTGHTLEVTKRANAVTTRNTTTGTRFLGIGFRRYATNEKNEGTVTHGAISVVGTPNVLVENDVFTRNAGTALNFLGGPKNVVIRRVTFAQNGFNGLDANGTENNDNFTLTRSLFDSNNNEYFGLGCLAACTAASSKLAHMDNFSVTDNVFRNGLGIANGFWCDLHCTRGTMTGNLIQGNGGNGLIYEVSDTGVIANNLVIDNGSYYASRRPNGDDLDNSNKGSGIRVAASNTQIFNNTIVNNVADLLVYDDARSPGANCGGCTTHDISPDTTNVTVVNNLFSGVRPADNNPYSSWMIAAFRRDYFPGVPWTGPDTFFSRFDYNSYYRVGGFPLKLFWWDNDGATSNSLTSLDHAFASLGDVQAAKHIEAHGLEVAGGSNPFFADEAAGNYCLSATSTAVKSGTPLTGAMAAAVHVTAGQPISRGALGWLAGTCTG